MRLRISTIYCYTYAESLGSQRPKAQPLLPNSRSQWQNCRKHEARSDRSRREFYKQVLVVCNTSINNIPPWMDELHIESPNKLCPPFLVNDKSSSPSGDERAKAKTSSPQESA